MCIRDRADTVLFCDANASWGTAETRRFLAATRDLDYALEQPCATYEENLAIRRACDRPLVLDETIDSLDVLLRAIADGLVDGITIKLARVALLSPALILFNFLVNRAQVKSWKEHFDLPWYLWGFIGITVLTSLVNLSLIHISEPTRPY